LLQFGLLQAVGVLQGVVDSLILKAETNASDAFIAYAFAPMFTRAYEQTLLPIYWYAYMLSILAIISSTIMLQNLVGRMQFEKVNKIRDFMRMMGMQDAAYHLANFAFLSLTCVITATFITIFLIIMRLSNTNVLILWLTNLFALLSLYPFAVFTKYGRLGADSVARSSSPCREPRCSPLCSSCSRTFSSSHT
jgi:hypothetical protein